MLPKSLDGKQLHRLSEEQERPLFNVKNTVICSNLNHQPPKYVFETLSLGPKNSILGNFNHKEVLAELDSLLRFCRGKELNEELITDINIKTLTYIENCKKQKVPKNIQMTRRYLKEYGLVAVPFDEGIGICLMTIAAYNTKLEEILKLPQFEKLQPKRKNEKQPVLKEEERIVNVLKELKNKKKIS